ncbi:MAG: phosphoribosyltransferase family protein [Planctomycetota bacterium]|nr:phosphoribosyltransferase family protein [Planctomycetota bacterium]
MKALFMTYFGGIAAILTIMGSLFALSRWTRGTWIKLFTAKSHDQLVTSAFTDADVHAGVAVIVAYARGFAPDLIVGINRGGAVIGGILGKHLDKLVYVVEVRTRPDNVTFHFSDELLQGNKVLLVDDRLSSGHHMNLAYQRLLGSVPELRTEVFAWVQQPGLQIAPDSWGYKAESSTLALPWEPGASRQWH